MKSVHLIRAQEHRRLIFLGTNDKLTQTRPHMQKTNASLETEYGMRNGTSTTQVVCYEQVCFKGNQHLQ